MTEDLSWDKYISLAVGKTQQRLYHLKMLRSVHLHLMVNFYTCAISGVLTYGFFLWFASCTKAEQQALQWVVKAAGRINGMTLPVISTLLVLRRVKNILRNEHHPLPSERCIGLCRQEQQD